ncbi:MAG TPA: hemolysin family protein [Geopsychrobacteraceae bacterium]|nr:hemolysin family protein [Geopsychrobacteraceae bacterium]
MTEETIIRLLGLVLLLALSGFFSGSETALLALDRMRVKYLQQKQYPGADRLAALLESPDRLLGAILVGNNLVNIAATVVATGLLVGSFGEEGELLTILILTPVLLIFSELCPKTYAAQNPEKTSFLVLQPILGVLWLLTPVVRVVTLISGLMTGLLSGRKVEQLPLSEDEIKSIIQVGEESGVVTAKQRRMLHSIFDLSETRVRDVMLPRTEVVGIASDADFQTVLESVRNSGHSRFPVYDESLDNVVGIIHSKDVLAYADRPVEFSLTDNCRSPFFAPESTRVGVLLQTFRKKREHLAMVVDEYGGVEGIVTLEDVVEEIVGEIHDEYDIEEVDFRQLADRTYLADGAVSLRTVNRRFELNLPEEHVTTLAGYLLQQMGRIPSEGDRCDTEGVLFSVRRMDGRRIEEVIMTLPERPNDQ